MSDLTRRLAVIDAGLAAVGARRAAAWSLALVAAVWVAVAAVDRLWRPEDTGRWLLAAPLWAAMLGGLGWSLRLLLARRTSLRIAVALGKAFPELDDRLVNRVQFESKASRTSWEEAYLAEPAPDLGSLPWSRVTKPHLTRRALTAAGVALALLALPSVFLPEAWPNALGRTLLPASVTPAWSRARLVSVTPSSAVSVTRGDPLKITVEAKGDVGHEVSLEITPARGRSMTRVLGRIRGGGIESFAEAMPAVVGDFRFRVRVGDATPSARIAVTALPEPGFTRCAIMPEPPPGMRAPEKPIEALRERPMLAASALAKVTVTTSRDATAVTLAIDEATPMVLKASDGGWHGGWRVVSGREIRLRATFLGGRVAEERIPFEVLADRAPDVRVISPEGDLALAVGGRPAIRFEARDDRGLTRVVLERVPEGAGESTPGTPVRVWTVSGKSIETEWKADAAPGADAVAYRLVAEDNRSSPGPNRSFSRIVRFSRAAAGRLLAEERGAVALTREKLDRLVARQRENLAATLAQVARVPGDAAAVWKSARGEQSAIREGVLALRETPGAAMDTVVPILDAALKGPLADALAALDRVSGADATTRRQSGGAAAVAERRALETLLRAEQALNEADRRRETAAILALIEALVKEQESVVAAVANAKRADATLAAREDRLAEDYGDFLAACADTVARPQSAERELAPVLAEVMAREPKLRIKGALMSAAEALESGVPAKAGESAARALTGLRELRDLLAKWRVTTAAKTMADAAQAIGAAKAELKSLTEKQEKLLEALRATASQPDKSKGDNKAIDAEFVETKKEEAALALKIANDLQALPDLPVGNELVEDVYQVYEEMKQAAGSAEAPVSELGLQKEDWILAELAKAVKRLDDMEMWMVSKPDNVKRDIENFDRQELPEIGLIPMPEQMQDIIGDLLEQDDKLRAEADDSTGNQGTSDLPAGWGIAEGEFTSYAAKGMSGNERPEHKDQDGRSGIGRQGMADGEAVEASGAIKEGDNAIEKRMTRDSSQAGVIREQSEAEAVATGGGKLGGTAKERGMPGGGPRRDAPNETPSEAGARDQLRRQAEALHARASLANLRTGRLGEAVRHMRDASDSLADARDIRRVAEHRARAMAALKSTVTNLDAGFSTERIAEGEARRRESPGVSAGADEAPAAYRDMVNEYFKNLGATP